MLLIATACASESQQATAFFQQFNFDTLLALISCVAGVIALFLGGSAYHQCKKFKESFNDRKEYKDSSVDNSQKAAGNIYNQSCDVNTMAALTSQNFETSLNRAYSVFEQKAKENLREIICETSRIIHEGKLNISAYTKIDWINVYFENAKNSSDTYMQNVWAKVLARELATPGSFSFKTLDVLRNMCADDFALFERLLNLQIDGYVLGGGFTEKYIDWMSLLKLSELGLINLGGTTKTNEVAANGTLNVLFCDSQYAIIMKNLKEQSINAQYSVYFLTAAGKELLSITVVMHKSDYIVAFAKEIKEQCKANAEVKLHKVNYVNGAEFNYNIVDLLA